MIAGGQKWLNLATLCCSSLVSYPVISGSKWNLMGVFVFVSGALLDVPNPLRQTKSCTT